MNTLNNILEIVPIPVNKVVVMRQPEEVEISNEEKDLLLLQIQHQIHAKRDFLLQKQKYLNKMEQQNNFLREVKNDYAKYYNYILKQKQEQMEALDMLKQYVHDLTVSGSLSKQNIKDAKLEQKRILREMKNIKKDLDVLVENTDTNTNTNTNTMKS